MGEVQSFGQWLKARREAIGLTLREVEHITEGKVSNAYLSQLENGGIKCPSAMMVWRLSAALGLDVGEALQRALGGNEPPPAPDFCPTCGQVIRPERTP